MAWGNVMMINVGHPQAVMPKPVLTRHEKNSINIVNAVTEDI